jgi:GH43 family beta-xylosidase
MTYHNPIYQGYFADPFAFRYEGAYYAIGTGPSAFSDDADRAFPMLRSDDLVHWKPLPNALDRLDAHFGDDYWAPEIAFAEGKFYLYYSVGHGHQGHHIRVAMSDAPTGPFKDLKALTASGPDAFAIDASPFLDFDGNWYLYYSTDFLNGERPGTGIVVDRMTSMVDLAGEPKVVARPAQDWQRYERDRKLYGGSYDWHTIEGANVIRHGDQYFCLYSGGNFQDETYGVDFCVGSSPIGEFETGDSKAPRLLRTVPGNVRGPGHNSIVTAPHGDFLVYHAWNAEMTKRQMYIDPLLWTEDGPVSIGPTCELVTLDDL